METNNVTENLNQADGRFDIDPAIAKAAREVLAQKGIPLSDYVEGRLCKIVRDDRRACAEAYFTAISFRRECRSKLSFVFDSMLISEDANVEQACYAMAKAAPLNRFGVKGALDALAAAKEELSGSSGFDRLERLEAHLRKRVVSTWEKIGGAQAFGTSPAAAAEAFDALLRDGADGWHEHPKTYIENAGLHNDDICANRHSPARQRAMSAKEYFYLNWFVAE